MLLGNLASQYNGNTNKNAGDQTEVADVLYETAEGVGSSNCKSSSNIDQRN
jgi:hypothetical protein